MSRDIRATETYRALVACLIRRVQAEREAILTRCPIEGPITTDADRQASRDLAAADAALTALGLQSTK